MGKCPVVKALRQGAAPHEGNVHPYGVDHERKDNIPLVDGLCDS